MTENADKNRTLPPEALDAWAAELRERFGLAEEDLPIALILDLAAGLVAGRAGGAPGDVRAAVAAISELALAHGNA